MASVLTRFGYRIDRIPNTNYAGMEIDIEGTHLVTGHSLYCECKCYDTEIDAPKLQAFFGKYMGCWLSDKRSTGLFLAIPGINPHAKGFYNEKCAGNTEITVIVRNEDHVIEALVESGTICHQHVLAKAIHAEIGALGESNILVTETGIIIAQRIIPKGSLLPSHFALFDSTGSVITDRSSIERIIELEPELKSFHLMEIGPQKKPLLSAALVHDMQETIVEVKGGTECFEYQLPASPEYFIGRTELLDEAKGFASQILGKTSGLRGLLLEANSGWGKSSSVLACANLLKADGHSAVVIDSRSALSAQFILRVVDYVIHKLALEGVASAKSLAANKILGFDDAAQQLVALGRELEKEKRVLFIFLDQFENIFFLTDAFRRIRDLFLKVGSSSTNIAFGFCWKTDLVGLTSDFPYQLRDSIRNTSKLVPLDKFSEPETNALLDKLSTAIKSKLRDDLRFFLSEYSQGYPWLLKKLCAHVKKQRESGISQAEIANGLLNVEQLFREDLQGLAPDEETSLRRIARLSPVMTSDIGDEVSPQILQSLIDRRLIVRIGVKLDVYWDIFRDYLNTGKIPAQEQYLPRLSTRSVYKACRILAERATEIPLSALPAALKISTQSTYNVVHELRMMNLAQVDAGKIVLAFSITDSKELPRVFSTQIGDKLRKNRLTQYIVEALNANEHLSLSQASKILREKCPYISASQLTWEGYAEIFCDWLEAGGLIRIHRQTKKLSRLVAGQDIQEVSYTSLRRRGGVHALQVHFSPVYNLVHAFVQFAKIKTMEWPAMKPSTRKKCLILLEDLGLIVRSDGQLRLSNEFAPFLAPSADIRALLGEAALKIKSFAVFTQILESRNQNKCSLRMLGHELRQKMEAEWTDGTASTTAKISLDWARHIGRASGVFANNTRKPKLAANDESLTELFAQDLSKVDTETPE